MKAMNTSLVLPNGNDELWTRIYADLHIHIGRSGGRAIKVTASRNLDLRSIIFKDAPRKGLGMVGIVDSASTLVSAELEEMLGSGELTELNQGGFLALNGIAVIAASEVESREGVHLISYLPNLDSIKKWQRYMRSRVHNMQLSTQRADAGFSDIMKLCLDLGGIFCPAHAFTPHKGIYGMWTDKLVNKIGLDVNRIQALEIGLSADSDMADRLKETGGFTLLSNSDAHSSQNIGREFNLLQIKDHSFEELRMCIQNENGRRVVANYGMHPQLGKYHRTYCPVCSRISQDKPPVAACPVCGNAKVVMGVYDRIAAIQDHDLPRHPHGRPPYYYRIPLKDLPGIGLKTYNNLLQAFNNEIELMEQIPIEEIAEAAGKKAAAAIDGMRSGRLSISPGGGGKYGKVSTNFNYQ